MNFDNEQLKKAIPLRHSVRRYKALPLTEDVIDKLRQAISECNHESGLNIQLVLGEKRAFTGMLAYGTFAGVENYMVMVKKKEQALDENVGYYGEKLVLLAQSLGLNTCWVGLSYRKVKDAYEVGNGEKIACMIALGYGQTQGGTHRIKSVEQVSNVSDSTPEWFRQGVEAALLAPTAINQQKFYFEYHAPKDGAKAMVVAKRGFSMVGYTHIDLGIAKLHFELAADKDNFCWA